MKARLSRIARTTFVAAAMVFLSGCGVISKDFDGSIEFNFTIETHTSSYDTVAPIDPNSEPTRLAGGQVASPVLVGLHQSVGIGGQLSLTPPTGSKYELTLQYAAGSGECIAKGTVVMPVQTNGMTPVAFVALKDVLKPCPDGPAFPTDSLSLPPGELVVRVRPVGFRLTPKDRIYLKVQGFKVTVQKPTG